MKLRCGRSSRAFELTMAGNGSAWYADSLQYASVTLHHSSKFKFIANNQVALTVIVQRLTYFDDAIVG